MAPSGRRARIWSISARLCSTSRMRIQTRALTSPSVKHRHLEGELDRRADRRALRRVEGAARGAADIAAGAELARQFRAAGCRCRRCGPAARRCCRRGSTRRGESGARFRRAGREARAPIRGARSAATPPGTIASIIRRWPKAASRRAQHALAQDAAMGVHQREGGVVADRADVAEMIGEALQFGHQRRAARRRAAALRRRAPPRRRGRRRAA